MSRSRPSTQFDFSQEDHDLFGHLHRDIAQRPIDEPLHIDLCLASREEFARMELVFPPALATRQPVLRLTVYGQGARVDAAHGSSGARTVYIPGNPK